MRSDQAVQQIRSSVFKPGWRMVADALGPDLVLFTFYIDTVDTSYPSPDGVCRRTITLVRDEMIDVSGLDAEGLCTRIVRLSGTIEQHEDREFLKVRQPDGSWKSPLHPHTTDGRRAWVRHELREEASYG